VIAPVCAKLLVNGSQVEEWGGETQVNGVDGVRSLGTGPYTPSSPPPTRSQSERCCKVKVARYTMLCMSSKVAVEY
jgi:hypothetical protein